MNKTANQLLKEKLNEIIKENGINVIEVLKINKTSDQFLKEKLNEIIEENEINVPKISYISVVRSGFLGIPSKILIEDLDRENNKKINLFVKSAPSEGRNVIPIREIYLNEIAMYSFIIPKLIKFQKEKHLSNPFENFPKCYKTCDIENNEFLILENLKERGFVLWDKLKPMTEENVEFILKEIAKYHAVLFGVKEKDPKLFNQFLGKLCLNSVDLFVSVVFDTYKKNFETALKCFDNVTEQDIIKKVKIFMDNDLKKVLGNFSTSDESIIVHGDCWCNNYMFKFENASDPEDNVIKSMFFLDFQHIKLASPVIDLSFFLYCNGPQEVFDNLEFYLKVYHQTLCINLKEMGCESDKIFPFQKLIDHWRKFAKFGLTMACFFLNMYFDPKHQETVNLGQVMENGGSFEEMFVNFDVSQNEEYRNRIRGIVTHFVENDFI